MAKLNELLTKIVGEQTLIYAVISAPLAKGADEPRKVAVKPMMLRDQLLYQFEYHHEKKVTHRNLTPGEAAGEMGLLLGERFKQGQIYSKEADYQVFVNKGDDVRILTKAPSRQAVDLRHNRKKNYILDENQPSDFLIRLGVMNDKGKVLAAKYDKFRQINRFLEMVADIADQLPQQGPLRIVDFGCGKSYLTFALYHYLHQIKGLDLQIVGLDLKEDVVCHCNQIAQDLHYDRLKFLVGDIKDYQGFESVDMVVTLHACDTATDAALGKAVQWNARVILSVPCCQHELAKQMVNDLMYPMEKHGIIKERLAALVTDSLRANALEICGYGVQILEFIDMEHTPKNLLIRAVKKERPVERKVIEEYVALRDFWHLHPYIEEALGWKGAESPLASLTPGTRPEEDSSLRSE